MNATRLLIDGEAARLLRMPLKRLQRLAKAGDIPHILLPDDEIRFDPDDLREWVESRKQPCKAEAVPA